MLVCLVLSSARWCRSSICPGRLFTAWLVFLVIFSCHNFYGIQVVTLEVHLSCLRRLMCPAWDHFIFLTFLIISYFCALPDPDVGNSILVVDIEHISFHFGLCGRKFVLCLFGQCQMLRAVQIMEEALMIPPAPTPILQTSRKP